jgi:hypothetical protein
MSFDPPLSSIAKDIDKEIDTVNEKSFRAMALQLFSDIVIRTPVDTGAARGGFQADIGAAVPRVPEQVQPNPNKDITGDIKKNPKLLDYVLSNPLPYIEKLEFGGYGPGPKTEGGFSKQAPRGMIRVSIQEFERS